MERHDLDPIALVFGATFTVLGLAYAISGWSWIGVDGDWLLGAFLVALGIAGIVSATARPRRTASAPSDTVDEPPHSRPT